MRILSEVWQRLRSLLLRSQEEREMAEELRFHIDQETEQNLHAGMSAREARRQAHIKFGGVERMKERTRDARGVRWLDDLVQDIRLARRTLLKDRGFAAVVVLTLAVAIGANTAIFSVVDGVLIRPLPYPDADRLVTVAAATLPAAGWTDDVIPFSIPGYVHFNNNNRTFEAFGGYLLDLVEFSVFGDGEPLQVEAAVMLPSAFEALGTLPQIGRLPRPGEAQPGPDGPRLVLLSHGLWVRRFGADPSIVGRTIRLNDTSSEVIGVMPESFAFPTPEVALWVPYAEDLERNRRAGNHIMLAIARLAPGVTIEAAVADAESLIRGFDEVGYPASMLTGLFSGAAVVRPLREQLVGDIRQPLLILLGAMGFVLLIACSNVANLFLVRGEARTRASAVRMALGAGRGRLVRYVVTESLLLALLGGAAGVLLAYLGTRALVSFGPTSIPRLDDIGVRGSALLYTTGVSVFAGLLFGVFPALRSASDKMLGALRDGGRGATIGGDRHRARGALVVTQVALAVVLLVGSGLMVRSFQELRAVDPGFRAEGLLTFTISPRVTKYGSGEEVAQFYRELVERLEQIPGVTSAGGITTLPLSGGGENRAARIEEFPAAPGDFPPFAFLRRVTPGYFETMGIPVVEGRAFTPDDHNAPLGSLVISQSLKDRFWPSVSALDKRITIFVSLRGPVERSVGVVGDVHAFGMEIPAEPYVYKPLIDVGGNFTRSMTMVVRSKAEPLSLVPAIRRAVGSSDPDLPISDIRPMDDVVADSMSRTTFTLALLLLAAIIALILGSVGIYGVISYIVSQRTSEIAVRLALGADAGDLHRMVLMQGMKLAGAGAVIGLLAAAAMGRLLDSLLYGVGSLDPLTFVGGSVIFLAVAALSVVIPALRASRIPPAVALQST